MIRLVKNFLKDEDGLGTVEIVIILAVLVGLAIVFRKAIISFATGLMTQFFNEAADANKPVKSSSEVGNVMDAADKAAKGTP